MSSPAQGELIGRASFGSPYWRSAKEWTSPERSLGVKRRRTTTSSPYPLGFRRPHSHPISFRRLRVAPGDEGGGAEFAVRRAVAEWLAVGADHRAARGNDDRMARGDVPFVRRRKARGDVG